MGTYYSLYAEVRVGNKWYNLNPLFQREDGSLDTLPIISGRNWPREAFEELEEERYACGRPKDLSDEVRKIFNHDDDEPYDESIRVKTYRDFYNRCMFLVNYGKAVKNRVKKEKPTRYRGYVSKVSLAAYEIDEYDSITNWLTEEEYEKLSDKQKKSYVYYEWDEPYDWYKIYNMIVNKVDCMLSYFCNWSEFAIKGENWDELHPTADYIRLIAYVC